MPWDFTATQGIIIVEPHLKALAGFIVGSLEDLDLRHEMEALCNDFVDLIFAAFQHVGFMAPTQEVRKA